METIKRILHIFPFVHFYSNWKTIKNGEMVKQENNAIIGHTLLQERECEICRKINIRTETKYY